MHPKVFFVGSSIVCLIVASFSSNAWAGQQTRDSRALTGLLKRLDESKERYAEDGRFKAVVQGTYDGINLQLKMVRIQRGAARYFEYNGEVTGNLGLISLRGIKTNKVATSGKIFLASR